jgi:hypothetical protein
MLCGQVGQRHPPKKPPQSAQSLGLIAINHAQSWVYLLRRGKLLVAVCRNSVKMGLDEKCIVSSVGRKAAEADEQQTAFF